MRKPTFNPEVSPPHVLRVDRHALPTRTEANARWRDFITALGAGVIVALAAGLLFLSAALVPLRPAHGRDLDGHWARLAAEGKAPPKEWWDALQSGKGLCCSFADGIAVKDVDWDTAQVAGADGVEIRFRVRACSPKADDETWADCKHKDWIVVPPSALVTVPNKAMVAVMWPYQDINGGTQIRCFMPGAGT